MKAIYNEKGDIGDAAQTILEPIIQSRAKSNNQPPLTVSAVYNTMKQIAQTSGEGVSNMLLVL